MNRYTTIATAFLIFSATPAMACECLQYPDVKLMLRSSDFAYVGEWVVPEYSSQTPAEAPVSFKVTDVLAGSSKVLNTTIALDRKKDVDPECRAFTGKAQGRFLVFGKMYTDKKETFLTDCATDMVNVASSGKLYMSGREISVDIKQLKTEPRPRLASEMAEDEAIEVAIEFSREEKKYEKRKYGVLNTQYKDMGGFRPYWVVRFSEFPPVPDGEVFKVKVYNTGKEGMMLENEE